MSTHTHTSSYILHTYTHLRRMIAWCCAGDFLLVGEAADFCHIYDCHNDLRTCQEINFFGEVAGVDISPDGSSLFIGVTDNIYGMPCVCVCVCPILLDVLIDDVFVGSLLEFHRRPMRWSETALF